MKKALVLFITAVLSANAYASDIPEAGMEAAKESRAVSVNSPSSESGSAAASLPDEDSTAQKIRERLSQGHSAADIAREFHIGRGAVELIEQMGKNKTER